MAKKYRSDHTIGENNVQLLGMDIHNPVFVISASFIVLFVVLTIQFPAHTNTLLGAARACENHTYVISSTYTDVSSKWMISAV